MEINWKRKKSGETGINRGKERKKIWQKKRKRKRKNRK